MESYHISDTCLSKRLSEILNIRISLEEWLDQVATEIGGKCLDYGLICSSKKTELEPTRWLQSIITVDVIQEETCIDLEEGLSVFGI